MFDVGEWDSVCVPPGWLCDMSSLDTLPPTEYWITFANLIFINIIIAFIIDTYQSIDLTLKAESDAKKLKNKANNSASQK